MEFDAWSIVAVRFTLSGGQHGPHQCQTCATLLEGSEVRRLVAFFSVK